MDFLGKNRIFVQYLREQSRILKFLVGKRRQESDLTGILVKIFGLGLLGVGIAW